MRSFRLTYRRVVCMEMSAANADYLETPTAAGKVCTAPLEQSKTSLHTHLLPS